MSPMRVLVAVGPAVLALLFLVRALVPGPDPVLLGVFAVLAGSVVAMATGSRIGAGLVLVLSLAMFQPVVTRDISFSISAVDSTFWRWWAVAAVLTIGVSIVASALALTSLADAVLPAAVSAAAMAGASACSQTAGSCSAQPGRG